MRPHPEQTTTCGERATSGDKTVAQGGCSTEPTVQRLGIVAPVTDSAAFTCQETSCRVRTPEPVRALKPVRTTESPESPRWSSGSTALAISSTVSTCCSDVPCGVLSEDAAFDLFGDHLRTAIRMLELGTAMVKER